MSDVLTGPETSLMNTSNNVRRLGRVPAVSNAQRKLLYAKFGAAWVKRHGFDTKGPLPEHKMPSALRKK